MKWPKIPHLKPKPKANDVLGSYDKEESLSFSLSKLTLNSSKSLDSTGYNPLKTIGLMGL